MLAHVYRRGATRCMTACIDSIPCFQEVCKKCFYTDLYGQAQVAIFKPYSSYITFLVALRLANGTLPEQFPCIISRSYSIATF